MNCWISHVLSAFLFLITIAPAHAVTTPPTEVLKGLTWLQAQVQVSGVLANEPISTATPIQNRSEALQSFKLLASIPAALTDQLVADNENNTEYLARRAVALSLAGRDASAITAQLVARQNIDGGFGGAIGYASNAQDTALVVLALAQNAQSALTVAQKARSYLLAAIQADGGVGVGSASARISANAVVLLALQAYATDLNTANAIKQINAWLLLKQGTDGSWQGDNYLTALALAAVSPQVSDPAIRTSARTYLIGLQATDGSWEADPFLTAVVIRALAYEPAATPIVTTSIIGQVLDQNTATALGGATIALSGASTVISTTTMDGKISVQNLVAGNYTLQVTKAGYVTYSNSIQLTAGQSLDIGSIALGQLPTMGIVRGQVTVAATGIPLSGVTVQLNGSATASTVTDANGLYEIVSVAPGSVTLSASLAGYTMANGTGNLLAGQTLVFSPALITSSVTAPTTGQFTGVSVHGQVTAAATGAPLSGVTVQLSGSTTASATTDANGLYSFVSVPPGAVNLSAAIAGYATATGSGNLLTGQTLVFSPALLAAPTNGHFTGKVVATGGAGPLAGVGIDLNGVNVGVTATDGSFDLVMPPASYNATFTLAGYGAATSGFLLTAGAVVDAGFIELSPQLTSTAISGIIKDAVSGNPISGAQVQLINGAVVQTAADGSYSLSGLIGTSFVLRVSAVGYVAQSIQFQASRPTTIVHDFLLPVQSGAGLSLDPLLVSPGSTGSRADISIGATVTNSASGTPVSAVLAMQVLDAQGKVVSNAIAYDKTGTNLLGQFTLNSSQQLPVVFHWNSGQFPAGTYSLIARVVEVDSMSTATPLGRILTEAQGSVTITADQHFGGAITADPPVLQINTNTPVHLSAILTNDGNSALPAQAYQLQVVEEKTGNVVATQQANGTAFSPSELQTLTFADWMPGAGGGNYRLELQAVNSTNLGKVTGKVYVGDAATASFTVNKLVVPAGTQSVKGSIKVTGQDATQGTISDPLAPLIKAAIQKAVTYNDAQASSWYSNNRCLGCHVVTQALVGGELNRSITTFNATQRNTLFNALVNSQKSDGSLDMSHPMYARTQTILGLWALNSWHNKSEILAPALKAARYLLGRQEASGRWTADHASGWWSTPVGNTGLTTKSLVEVDELIKQTPPSALPLEYSFNIHGSTSSVPGRYKGAAADAAGNIYLTSNSAGTLTQVKPDGTTKVLLTGLIDARPPVFGSDGALYIPSNPGVYKYILSSGQKTTVSTTGATNLALGPDGNIYAANYWHSKITKITPSGVASDYIVGGLLRNPHGIGFDQAGDLLVANTGASQILKYAAGNTTSPTVVANVYALSMDRVGTEMFVASGWNGVIRYDSAWRQLGIENSGNYSWSLAKAPDGRIMVGDYLSNFRVALGTPIQLPTLGAAITKATDWLLVDGNITSSNNLDLAHRIIGLGSALRYFSGTAKAATIQSKMDQVAATLRGRQHGDGGWGWMSSYVVSDSMVTAQVGFALDYLHPSPKDPIVQNAIKLLLSRQQADGSWRSEHGILSTRLAATTWVAIWLPIALDRIGGIDTDLTVSMPANVSLSNPSLVPTTSMPNAIGGTDYVWTMQGVTSAGRDINFDLTLANMSLDENRPVAAESYLTFNNSFTQAQVKAPVAVPRVTASAFLNLGVTTDKTSYSANVPVNITAAVNNTSTGTLDGGVKLEIYDSNNYLTAVVGTQSFMGLPAGAQQSLSAVWNTGGTIAGGYYVLSTLYDSQNRQVGTAKSAFDIVPSGTAGVPGTSGVGATVTVDKISYRPFDALRVNGRVTNLLQNQSQSDLMAAVSIYRPDGTLLWTQTGLLQQLVVGSFLDLGWGSQLTAAAVGTYRVILSVQNSVTGLEVAVAQTSFVVLSSDVTGSGLKGQIAALPKIVPQTDPVILDGAIDNLGNADLTALPVTVRIVEPVTQQVMSQWNYSANVVVGQPFQTALTWDTSTATIGTTYVAVLSATVAGKEITLAQDNFTVTDPPVKLDVIQSGTRENRVLVWLACDSEESQDKKEHKDDKGHQDQKAHNAHATDHADHGDDDHAKPVPLCLQKRSAYLQGLLTSYTVPYLITTHRNDFRKAFRSGRYNVYWISGAVKAEGEGDHEREGEGEGNDDILKEVREAVYRGDSLILDGEQAEHNEALLEAAGVEYRGKLPAKDSPVTTSGLMFGAAQIQTVGKANKLLLTTGIVQALFDKHTPIGDHDGGHDEHDGHDGHPDEHDDTHPEKPQPAIVGNAYGRGQALIFGFDLVDNLQNGAGMAAWNGILLTGLANLMPPVPDKYSAGAYVSLTTRIQELAKRTTDLAVTAHLPTGATLLNTAPAATLDANGQPVWNFTLPAEASKSLLLTLRLPLLSGNHVLPLTVDSIRNGKSKRYGEYSYSWTVTASDSLLSQVTGDLQLLVLNDAEERKARDKAVSKLQQATTFIARKQYGEALDALLEAVDKLRKIRSVDVGSYRLSLDRLLQETGWNWLRAAGL